MSEAMVEAAGFMASQFQFQVAQLRDRIEYEYTRPSLVHNPKLFLDGNKWCFLFGDNLQDGVAGFGDSPELAAFDFDKSWIAKLAGGYSGR